jgi:hypothetical protein
VSPSKEDINATIIRVCGAEKMETQRWIGLKKEENRVRERERGGREASG